MGHARVELVDSPRMPSPFRKLYLPENNHFRLRMLAHQPGMKLSEFAVEVLDKALPKWNVDRLD